MPNDPTVISIFTVFSKYNLPIQWSLFACLLNYVNCDLRYLELKVKCVLRCNPNKGRELTTLCLVWTNSDSRSQWEALYTLIFPSPSPTHRRGETECSGTEIKFNEQLTLSYFSLFKLKLSLLINQFCTNHNKVSKIHPWRK